jgi:translation initiation factor 5B
MREILIKVDDVSQGTEWDRLEKEIRTEFDRLEKAKLAFAEIGFNTCIYWENQDVEEYISLCPTSAITGEGLPDLMTYLS